MRRHNDPRDTRRHRRLRMAMARTLPAPCHRCGEVVQPWDRWHLDHVVAVVHGGGHGHVAISHASCNLKAGGQTRRLATAPPSRDW